MNIFYDNVDINLQTELNARGRAGFSDRTNNALNFMLSKIANVKITAFEGTGSASKPISTSQFGILGGSIPTSAEYLPSGEQGFLADRIITSSRVDFYGNEGTETDYKAAQQGKLNPQLGEAYDRTIVTKDDSRRVGPYITTVDVQIGDHSMGLLNKATIQFSIPNPHRDIDAIENTWFRPGRFIQLEIAHPNSVIVSRDAEGRELLLTEDVLPNEEKLKSLYPGIGEKLSKLKENIRRMNVFTFEGLITSFDFSYSETGTVDANLSVTGTSNVYADISMYLPGAGSKTDETKNPTPVDPNFGQAATTQSFTDPTTGKTTITEITGSNEFYETLYNRVDQLIDQYIKNNNITANKEEVQVLTNFSTTNNPNTKATDQFILAGQTYNTVDQYITVPKSPTAVQTIKLVGVKASYERYITLGALMEFINQTAVKKFSPGTDTTFNAILHDDTQCFSNYYPYLTSCNPTEVILLPTSPHQIDDMNWHGELGYFKDIVVANTLANSSETWPGVYGTLKTANTTTSTIIASTDDKVIFTSRIFINLKVIQNITEVLSNSNRKTYTVSKFLGAISNYISYATGDAINLKLVSTKADPTKLIFIDTNYLKSQTIIDANSNSKAPKKVEAYSIPMFSNHPNGSIVHDFKFSAQLPDNVKNLSYVLNSGDKISTNQIAPYINYMYNSNDAKSVNAGIKLYRERHYEIINNLRNIKIDNGKFPNQKEKITKLYKALADYIKIPTPEITKSQQITAPIFPFTAEFTIDGINGFRYGDVLTFDVLPKKYRVNTVFSVISVSHTVSSDGQWSTNVKCIMRPSIS
jgi:hypothetical protein